MSRPSMRSCPKRPYHRLFAASVMLVCMGWFATIGQAAQASGDQPSGHEQAMQWIERAQQAAKTLSYRGTFAHQRDGQMRAFRVTHRFSDGQAHERLEVLNSSPREYLRVNDRVQCVIPDRQLVISERQTHDRFPALLLDTDRDLAQYYRVGIGERPARVAARACQPVSIVPKDAHRVRYELCIDQKTGLLLEAQTRDHNGTIVEHIAFHDVEVGGAITDAQLRSAWPIANWPVVQRKSERFDWQASGWYFRPPPGYQTLDGFQRQFADGRLVKQVILTDGLATISIFIEPYRSDLSHHQMVGAKRSGAVNLFGKQYGAHWVMVAGEAPPDTVRELAESIVRPGVLHNKQ